MKLNQICILFLILVFSTGCETMGDKTKKGAGIGALTGAAIGGIVGHQSGHGWEGALIGGAAGATAGGLIGNQMDKREGPQGEASGEYLSINEIADMARGGASDSFLMDAIDNSGASFELTTEDITYLKDSGVSNNVIDYMLAN